MNKPQMRVEFTINAESLGHVVLMVEEVGASDFTFVTIKEPPRRRMGRPPKEKLSHDLPEKKPRKKRKYGAGDAVLKLLGKKGSANKQEITKVLTDNQFAASTVNGLIWRLQRDGHIVPLKRGSGIFQLAKATLRKSNGEAEVV